MMMSDDARSDFVLAAAGAALIPLVQGLVQAIPLYSDLPTLVLRVLALGWMGASLMLVPVIISRHRDQGPSSWEWPTDRSGIRRGLMVGVPIVALGTLRGYSITGSTSSWLGQAVVPATTNPTISSFNLEELVFRYGRIVVAAVGLVVFTGFLINRARDAFREVAIPVVEALRTYGMAAVGVALVTGLLLPLRGQFTFIMAVGAALTLLLTILVADRLVYRSMETTRASILAPGVVTAVLHVLSVGGPIRGDLLLGLWLGALGFGIAVVAASLAGTKATRAAWIVPVLATALWPSCLATASFTQIGGGFCGLV